MKQNISIKLPEETNKAVSTAIPEKVRVLLGGPGMSLIPVSLLPRCTQLVAHPLLGLADAAADDGAVLTTDRG